MYIFMIVCKYIAQLIFSHAMHASSVIEIPFSLPCKLK